MEATNGISGQATPDRAALEGSPSNGEAQSARLGDEVRDDPEHLSCVITEDAAEAIFAEANGLSEG